MLAQRVSQPAPSLASLRPEVPAKLAGVIDGCLAKAPEARPQSGDDVARVLGEDLQADVVDDHRMPLGDPGIAMIRKQVAAIDAKMQAYPIPPGSALARRLFS